MGRNLTDKIPAHFFLISIGERVMRDVTVHLENRPGALAEMGESLWNAGVSTEGGGGLGVVNWRPPKTVYWKRRGPSNAKPPS